MPSYGGESDSGYGGDGVSQGGGFNYGGGLGTSGLDGAPDIGTLGGTFADADGENSVTLGGMTTDAQSGANQGVNANSFGYDFGAAGLDAPGEFSLSNLFGYETPTGMPTNSGEFMGNQEGYGFSDFATSPFGKTLRSVLGMTPFGKVANIGIDAAMGKPLGQIAANAVPGQLGVLGRMGYAAATSPNPASTAGRAALGYGLGTLGSNVGYGVAGPLGAMAGGMLGSAAAGTRGGPATGPSASGGGGGFNVEGALAGLGSLYAGHQNKQISDQMAQGQASNNQALQGQMSNLANMYSPNSPYAQQMRQQLARKDAAAGRNSQYGPREAQLQALLAGQQAQASSSMANLAGAQKYDQMRAGNTANTQNLQNMLQLAKASGLTDRLQGGLNSMFNQGGAQMAQAPQEYLPEAPSYNMDNWGTEPQEQINWG